MGIRGKPEEPKEKCSDHTGGGCGCREACQYPAEQKANAIKADTGYVNSLQLLLPREQQRCLKHKQKLNQMHLSLVGQPVKGLGSRAERSRKDQHTSPANSCATRLGDATSAACPAPRSVLLFLHFRDTPGTLLQPGCLRLQQLPSLAIRKPSQEGARKLSSCDAEQGMQTNGLCHAWGCCSEPRLSSTSTTGMPSLPAPTGDQHHPITGWG